MKLWKITPVTELNYDYVRHMVVRAKNKSEALKLFKKEIGTELRFYNLLHLKDQVTEISIDGEAEVICVDFLEA